MKFIEQLAELTGAHLVDFSEGSAHFLGGAESGVLSDVGKFLVCLG